MFETCQTIVHENRNSLFVADSEHRQVGSRKVMPMGSNRNRARVLNVVAFAMIAATVSGCAPKASDVAPTYVPASKYYNQSCSQLVSQRNDMVGQLNVLTLQQSKKSGNDAAAVGVGAILFWPALFFIGSGNDNSAQISVLKGEYDAITSAGGLKNCFVG